MDAIQPRTDALAIPASSQTVKTRENKEPALETLPDNDTDDSLKTTSGTINLSNTSIKLSASSPVQSTDQTTPIETKDQAQQALSKLLTDFQSNPSQAPGSQSNVLSGAVGSLLGSG